MVTPGTPRDAARRPLAVVDPADPEWKQAGAKLRNLAIAEAGPTPAEFSAAFDRVCRAHPDLKATWDAMGRGTQQQNKAPERTTQQANDPPRPLRRAHLDQHGNAISWTDTGVIINDLEIVHEPSFEEANREIAARQCKHMHAGLHPRAALAQALKEVPPVFRIAYLR
jgi:hypothetical protein